MSPPLHELPYKYGQRLPQFDGRGKILITNHVDKIINFIDLKGVDYEVMKLGIFSQFLTREVRMWYKILTIGSIPSFQ